MTNPLDKPRRALKWLALKWLTLAVGGLAVAFVVMLAGSVVYDMVRPLPVKLPAVARPGVAGAAGAAETAEKNGPETKIEKPAPPDQPTTGAAPTPVPDDKNLVPHRGLKPEQMAQADELNRDYFEIMRLLDEFRQKRETLDYNAAFDQLGAITKRDVDLSRRFYEYFRSEKDIFLWSYLRLDPLRNDLGMNYYDLFTRNGHWLQAANCCRELHMVWDREVACARRAGAIGAVYLARRRYELISDAAHNISNTLWARLN